MRLDIINAVVSDLERTKKFRKIYKNIIPMWTDVKDFPAVGLVYETDQMERNNLVNSKAYVIATIPICIYNKQKTSDYDDNLSEYVEIVQKVIETNEFLRNNTIEAIVSDFKRDGGMLLPYSVAQLTLKVKYIKRMA